MLDIPDLFIHFMDFFFLQQKLVLFSVLNKLIARYMSFFLRMLDIYSVRICSLQGSNCSKNEGAELLFEKERQPDL